MFITLTIYSETIVILKNEYSKDKNNAYYFSGKIEGDDSTSSEVLPPEPHNMAKDKNHIYDWDKVRQ